eukprot:4826816-Prymnesium_polylepis.1
MTKLHEKVAKLGARVRVTSLNANRSKTETKDGVRAEPICVDLLSSREDPCMRRPGLRPVAQSRASCSAFSSWDWPSRCDRGIPESEDE